MSYYNQLRSQYETKYPEQTGSIVSGRYQAPTDQPSFNKFGQRELNRFTKFARIGEVSNALRGNIGSPQANIYLNQFRDRTRELYDRQATQETERNISLLGAQNDPKVSGYFRSQLRSDFAKRAANDQYQEMVLPEMARERGRAMSMEMAGNVRGVRTSMSNLYDQINREQAQLMSSGGLFGEIAQGGGQLAGNLAAARLYAKIFANEQI